MVSFVSKWTIRLYMFFGSLIDWPQEFICSFFFIIIDSLTQHDTWNLFIYKTGCMVFCSLHAFFSIVHSTQQHMWITGGQKWPYRNIIACTCKYKIYLTPRVYLSFVILIGPCWIIWSCVCLLLSPPAICRMLPLVIYIYMSFVSLIDPWCYL